MDCIFYFETMSTDYEYFELTSVLDDYKIKIDFTVFGEDAAKIILSEGNSWQNESYLFGRYKFLLIIMFGRV